MDRRIKAGAIAILATTTVAIICVDEASARSFRPGGGLHRAGGHHVRAPRMVHRQPRLTRPARTIQLRVPHRTLASMPTGRHPVTSLAQVQRVKWHQILQNQAALRAAATGQRRIFAQVGAMQPQIGQRPAPMPGLTNPMPPAIKLVQQGSVTVAVPARVRIPEGLIGGWDVPRVSSTVRTTTYLGSAVSASPAADRGAKQAQEQAEAEAKKQEAAERKAQWLKELRAAAEAEEENRQAQAERKAQWLKELRAAAEAEKEHGQAQFDKWRAQAEADAQTRRQAAEVKFQAEQAAARERQRQIASEWSKGYDAQEKNWQARNITIVDGNALTPDQVAELNAKNERTYKSNRTPHQVEDDLEELVTPGSRSNGTTGFKPIQANTTNTPRPVKPANYIPPGQR